MGTFEDDYSELLERFEGDTDKAALFMLDTLSKGMLERVQKLEATVEDLQGTVGGLKADCDRLHYENRMVWDHYRRIEGQLRNVALTVAQGSTPPTIVIGQEEFDRVRQSMEARCGISMGVKEKEKEKG